MNTIELKPETPSLYDATSHLYGTAACSCGFTWRFAVPAGNTTITCLRCCARTSITYTREDKTP